MANRMGLYDHPRSTALRDKARNQLTRAKGDMAGRLTCQKRFVKTHATVVNIHIRPPLHVMYFYFFLQL